ncbi:MAG: hypothetical protein M1834_008139 [Cirrosporium novae-zelandiae]|nr:MAG: hypothetical protein M1834_008139 [Cirrosporium novae-zelandiae]
MSSFLNQRLRSSSRSSHQPSRDNVESTGWSDRAQSIPAAVDGRSNGPRSPSATLSTSTISLATSASQRTPTRSFFARSFHGGLGPIDNVQHSSQGVREDTAQLASRALSDAVSSQATTPPVRSYPSAQLSDTPISIERGSIRSQPPNEASDHPAIEEVPEPSSPDELHPDSRLGEGRSALTEMIRTSPPNEGRNLVPASNGTLFEDQLPDSGSIDSISGDEEYSEPDSERTALLIGRGSSNDVRKQPSYGTPHDIENQLDHKPVVLDDSGRLMFRFVQRGRELVIHAGNPKIWNIREIGRKTVIQPAQYIPAVILGLLMNVLDALSYGMILFPLAQPLFSSLGTDGISMFYVSCIVSQLVYSLGGSIFKGAVGSEMIEVVPFFHKMAFIILGTVGEDHPESVLATTVLSYALSSVLTGLVFFLMGYFKLGTLIGFFPRHILVGCIGGVGYFLIVTGLEVTSRLSGNLEYNLHTLQYLFQPDIIPLWLIPLVLSITLIISRNWVKSPWFVPAYFFAIPTIFYFVTFAIPQLNLPLLRAKGWVFEAPDSSEPWYHFYTLYNFKEVNWEALMKTIPNMFALTFFGILHVPINVPALGVATKEDYFDLNRELIAHGVSNALSGFCGSIQNYLVYTNSLLFIRVGGTSRVAGIMLAIGSFGILVIGPGLIGLIPIMMVGALIFMLGIDLVIEAVYESWPKTDWLEYLTIWVIVLVMGIWDFVLGILVGIILACASYVVKTSQKSAIRAMYSGGTASSTVRRHPVHHRFLQEAGRQTHVIKLAGFLFFGTIVSVENRIRAILAEDAFSEKPIRFLILDLQYVDGLDYSAAEAFEKIKRLTGDRKVDLIISGFHSETDVGKRIFQSGLFNKEDSHDGQKIEAFADLNSALEFCENELLKTFYQRHNIFIQRDAPSEILDVPSNRLSTSFETVFSSPRRHQLHQVAMRTLQDEQVAPVSKWRKFKQPLPLLLQTFHGLTEQNEDFWQNLCPYLERKEYEPGTVIYKRGDHARGFYILQEGILRAEYSNARMDFYESIVAGTTCGELPFFSETDRTATVCAEKKCIAWRLDEERWNKLQQEHQDVSQELLKIGMKLTSERMSTIVSYMMTIAG